MELKGCVLELAQRNSQISVPFAISNLGYGFLWNNPAVGHVNFAKNVTEWVAESTREMDYWITAADTPQEILYNFTEVTGRAPVMPDDYLGFWQCKLRYRTQEEVLSIARKYKDPDIVRAMKVIPKSNVMDGSNIFDEIDNGISGITASIVGKKLKEIAKNHQIICITHLPQIAACGNTNYRIYKESDSSKTYTSIEKLDNDAKIKQLNEIIRNNVTKIFNNFHYCYSISFQ